MTTLIGAFTPWAFDVFQFWIGGTAGKRKLVAEQCHQCNRILEVGCSVGNIASVFLHRNIEYVGVDIDRAAIQYAQFKYRRKPNFSFVCADLRDANIQGLFDCIVFSAVLHHLNASDAKNILEFSKSLLADGGQIIVSDVLHTETTDNLLIRLYGKIERGQFVRTENELETLLNTLNGLVCVRQCQTRIPPLPFFSKPTCSLYSVYRLTKSS
jgi:SAM-dependent methyltransferase